MKKTYFILAAASMMVAASACSGNKTEQTAAPAEEKTETVAEYTGVVPGADVDGIRYTVKLTAATDTTGTYDMTEAYLQGDSIAQSFDTKGDYTVIAREGTKYVKLGDGAGATYFRCDADTAITMVNADLEPSVTADYTLPRTK